MKEGLWIVQSDESAVEWWLKSANSGYVPCQFSVGSAYLIGKGIEKDLSQAKYWLQKVIDSDDEEFSESAQVLYDIHKLAWSEIGESYGDTWYINMIKEHKGYIYFWRLTDYLKPNEDGTMSVKAYYQGDCGIIKNKLLSFIGYRQPMGNGESETFNPTNSEWEYPVPESIAWATLDWACNYMPPTDISSKPEEEDKNEILAELRKQGAAQSREIERQRCLVALESDGFDTVACNHLDSPHVRRVLTGWSSFN